MSKLMNIIESGNFYAKYIPSHTVKDCFIKVGKVLFMTYITEIRVFY